MTESFSEAAVWQASSSLRRAALPDSHTLVFNPSGPQSVAILNSPAHEVLAGFRTPLRLTQATQILPKLQPQTVLSTARELASIGLLVPVENLQSTVCNQQSETLVAWLHLTDRCNLCCDYCYLPHIQEDMSSETGRVTVDATFRSAEKHGFQQIKLKYSGGEPLLRFPLVIELHQYAQALAEQYGLSLDGVVLSNGTLLTTEIVEALKTAGIRLMISLDGQGDYHDRHRRYASGRGSSADVAESIELALAHGLMPNISITISPRTVDGLPEVIAWVLERDLPFNLNFYRENEHSVSHADMRLDEERIINGMLAAYKVIEANLPRHSLLPSLVDRANLASPHLRTCGIGENYLVFDSRGRVSKCQMKMDKPVADVSTPDPLSVVRADQLGVQNISVEEKEPCRDCQWRYWCTGGCPLETYRVTGRYDVKSPNCTIYQALFPEVLRLEGLRLLKYQDDPQVVQKIVL
ncbi:MAG: radical SAM protein [Chloroflexi bacterium]|nr:radical SAM protein [Chloroflexota bacterium]